jgi:hypothetical protein
VERTEVFNLKTEEDVKKFCDLLIAGKEKAPVSLTYTVAITAVRSAKVIKIYNPDEEKRGPLESGFDRLALL